MGRIVEAVMGDLVRCHGPVADATGDPVEPIEVPAVPVLSLHRATLERFREVQTPLGHVQAWKWDELLGFCETLVALLEVDAAAPDVVPE